MLKKKLIIPVVALMLVANTGAVFAGDADDRDDIEKKETKINPKASYSKVYNYVPSAFDITPLTYEEIQQRNDNANH
ncbi:hypothetical protein [Wukongibacter sp. M2B1]|uniref:hypothetical protein n=1 Tax=Wukongibacter sp. M2B1 TaxID=3088895 RepID=UPI003D7BD15D